MKERWFDRWALAAFLLPMALYLTTLAPSVTTQDSGEFMTAIAYLGSAHSPGYPLFILFAKPFTWLPFGSFALRVNLATAVSAALLPVVVLWLLRALQRRWNLLFHLPSDHWAISLTGLSAGLLLATSPRLWVQTNHAKPYPLVALLVGLVLLCLVQWHQERAKGNDRPAWWLVAAFVTGLGTGAHQLIVLFIPGMILFVMVSDLKRCLRVRDWLLSGAALCFGMLVQAYLPVRAMAGTRQNWGDPGSWHGFLWHVLRKGYPETPHERSMSLFLEQLAAFSPLEQFGWVGLVLLLIGSLVLLRQARPVFIFVFAGAIMYLVVILGHFNPDSQGIQYAKAFFTPLYFLCAVVIAVGLLRLVEELAGHFERLSTQAAHLAGWCSAAVFVALPAWSGYEVSNQSRNYLAHDYAVNSLMALPQRAVLVTWGDSGAFPLWYLQGVERLREDVDIVHIPHLGFAWYQRDIPRLSAAFDAMEIGQGEAHQLQTFMQHIAADRSVFVDYSTMLSIGFDQAVPFGILYYVQGPRLASDPVWVWQRYTLARMRKDGFALEQDDRSAIAIHRHMLRQAIVQVERDRGERAALPLMQRLLDSTEF